MSKRSLLTLIVAALLLAAIAFGTLMPTGKLPPVPGSDKLQHFAAFAAVALVITLLRPGWVLPVMALLVIYGGLIEVIQPFVGRSRELADFIADASGVLAGGLSALFIRAIGARAASAFATIGQ